MKASKNKVSPNKFFAEIGKKGGQSKSPKKVAAVRDTLNKARRVRWQK